MKHFHFKTRLVLSALAIAALSSGTSAFAASKLMKSCKGDLKKFGCTAKTDAEASACLEKNEKEGEKNEGFSASCYKAHESYEKKMGKEEKNEHHEESAEKQQ